MIQSKYPPAENLYPEIQDSYDVVVIGAGPAGATVSTLLSMQGYSVAVFERLTVPRFHVGESLLPETYWTLKRLGLLETMKQSAYPKKFSVQFITRGWKVSAPFYFDAYNNHESAQTWQVERADFDKMLIDNAVANGATVRMHAHVLEVLFEENTARGVKVKQTEPDGTTSIREIRAKVVVDCSGNSAFLSSRLKLREPDPRLRMGVVWTYFKNAKRDPGKDEGATLVLQTEGKKSWFWYIPLRDNVISIGCVGRLSYMFPPGETPQQAYQRELERCPALQERLVNAERCMEYFVTKDFSYRSKEVAGNGWVLCGDAASFVDPCYSSGVFLALKSGEFVADAVVDAFKNNDFSGERLGAWYPQHAYGVDNFRKLVYAFYTPEFSFGNFLRKYPHFRRHITDILTGDVYKPELNDLFDAMGVVLPPVDEEERTAPQDPQVVKYS